ncbi:MAG: hypothetical protein WC976_06435 [Caldisericia bacterium]
MSNTEKLKDKLVDMFRERMTDEQFKNFAFEFIGAEALAEYIERELDGASPSELKGYIKQAKSYLKKEKTCKK